MISDSVLSEGHVRCLSLQLIVKELHKNHSELLMWTWLQTLLLIPLSHVALKKEVLDTMQYH